MPAVSAFAVAALALVVIVDRLHRPTDAMLSKLLEGVTAPDTRTSQLRT